MSTTTDTQALQDEAAVRDAGERLKLSPGVTAMMRELALLETLIPILEGKRDELRRVILSTLRVQSAPLAASPERQQTPDQTA